MPHALVVGLGDGQAADAALSKGMHVQLHALINLFIFAQMQDYVRCPLGRFKSLPSAFIENSAFSALDNRVEGHVFKLLDAIQRLHVHGLNHNGRNVKIEPRFESRAPLTFSVSVSRASLGGSFHFAAMAA